MRSIDPKSNLLAVGRPNRIKIVPPSSQLTIRVNIFITFSVVSETGLVGAVGVHGVDFMAMARLPITGVRYLGTVGRPGGASIIGAVVGKAPQMGAVGIHHTDPHIGRERYLGAIWRPGGGDIRRCGGVVRGNVSPTGAVG